MSDTPGIDGTSFKVLIKDEYVFINNVRLEIGVDIELSDPKMQGEYMVYEIKDITGKLIKLNQKE